MITTDKMKISIRDANINDLKRIVEIHINAFPRFFLTMLGGKFLKEYYTLVLKYPSRIFLTAEYNELIVGFVAGFLKPYKFYRQLRRNKIRLGLAITKGLTKEPKLGFRIFLNYKRMARACREKRNNTAELASIAVEPTFEGQGIGKLLVKGFLSIAAQNGSDQVILTTDAKNNDMVNKFYVSLGFRLNRSFIADYSRIMNEYIFYLK